MLGVCSTLHPEGSGGWRHVTWTPGGSFLVYRTEPGTPGGIPVRLQAPCAQPHVWLWVAVVGQHVCYLHFFQDVTKYQRTIANVFKDFSEDLQFVEALRVAQAQFLELLQEEDGALSGRRDFPFRSVSQAWGSGFPWGSRCPRGGGSAGPPGKPGAAALLPVLGSHGYRLTQGSFTLSLISVFLPWHTIPGLSDKHLLDVRLAPLYRSVSPARLLTVPRAGPQSPRRTHSPGHLHVTSGDVCPPL